MNREQLSDKIRKLQDGSLFCITYYGLYETIEYYYIKNIEYCVNIAVWDKNTYKEDIFTHTIDIFNLCFEDTFYEFDCLINYSKDNNACICDLSSLMISGCKCGGV